MLRKMPHIREHPFQSENQGCLHHRGFPLLCALTHDDNMRDYDKIRIDKTNGLRNWLIQHMRGGRAQYEIIKLNNFLKVK